MTLQQHTEEETQMILPEINVSNQLDWDETDFLSPQAQQTSTPPIPPSHQIPPIPQQQQQQEQQEELKEEEEKESESNTTTTTGLTRALSLPRQLNKTKEEEEKNIRKEVINISTSNPSHLFWVPASQHPEIAPAEFEKYVDAHGLIIRKKSVKRRQSVLSVYFTASDQQKLLDDLAKTDSTTERDRQATLDALENSHSNRVDNGNSSSNDNEEDRKRKLVLRRSVSLHLPTAGDYVRNVPESLVFDRNSSPLDQSRALVPKGDRPLLRRGARTNFKRNSSVTASNRPRPQLVNRKSESDYMNNKAEQQQQHTSVEITRSSSADSDRSGHRGFGVTLSDNTTKSAIVEEEEGGGEAGGTLLSPVAETEEVRDLCIATRELSSPSTTTDSRGPSPPVANVVMSRSASTSTATSSSSRKSAWSWAFWSDEKSSKKNNKIDPVETATHTLEPQPIEESINNRQPQVSKSSDAASLSSESAGTVTSTTAASLGGEKGEKGKRFTLSSLFSRKSKNGNSNNNASNYTTNMDLFVKETTTAMTAPKDFQLNRMNMTRLPLHVEKAIYKLSHYKLANPKRPLCQQVLISNQMFWYLSVIAQNNPQDQHNHQHHQSITPQQQQQKKKPRKLVKKQRPLPPQQVQQKKKEPTSKLTNNVIVGGGTFMTNNPSESSTGFVVPENYLNPKHNKAAQKKKSTNGLYNKEFDHHHHRHQQQQSSDSSSDEDEEDLSDHDEDDDEEEGQKEDDIPLALYKSNTTASHKSKSSRVK